ncbi:hypothetical protein Tco_0298443 [Tanacetum coccineum]
MRDTLTEGGEGALHLGPERARVFADLSAEQKDRYKADIRATNILLQVQDGRVVVQDVRGRYNANNQGRPFQRNNAREMLVAGNAGGQKRDGNVNPGQAKPIMCYNCKGIGAHSRELVYKVDSDRNRKETSLKLELHSAQLQLRSTLNHHKIVREEAIILKKDFKQKEDKFLEEFLDIKRLKEKVEDRLYKQDQSDENDRKKLRPQFPKTTFSIDSVLQKGKEVLSKQKDLPTLKEFPLFKLLKESLCNRSHTALFKEVKVMEEIFDQMNDEVDQNTVDKQCEIVKKNLLIENENLIANCLSNQLLYDVEKSRCLDLEAEMSSS